MRTYAAGWPRASDDKAMRQVARTKAIDFPMAKLQFFKLPALPTD